MSHKKVYSRGGVFAWSGVGAVDGGVVVAEAAQQIDFSRTCISSFFDFISIDEIESAVGSLQLVPTQSSLADFKLNALSWSPFCSEAHPNGLIIGGAEGGIVSVFDAARLTKAGALERVGDTRFHQGHVLSVDVSEVNPKWVCSGGAMGVVLLWDMNSPLNAMSPGNPHFAHQVKCVGWNRRIEPVLGSLTSERCSIWDLRAPGSPIIDIADSGGGVEWSVMRWSPHDDMSLCIASQNDSAPVVQRWDLRYASKPAVSYHIHTRGVFGMDLSSYDSRIMATVGRDEQIVFQDPATGVVLGRIPVSGYPRQLSFHTSNPNLLGVSYFDQPLEIYSVTPFNANADNGEHSAGFDFSFVPSWLTPGDCGAEVGCGRRMVHHTEEAGNRGGSVTAFRPKKSSSNMFILQALEAMKNHDFEGFWATVAQQESDPTLQSLFSFLSASCSNSSRTRYLNLLRSRFGEDLGTELPNFERRAPSDSRASVTGESVHSDEESSGPDVFPTDRSTPTSPSCQDVAGFMRNICFGNSEGAVREATGQSKWLDAALVSSAFGDAKSIRTTARLMLNDSSLDTSTRIVAMICAEAWSDVLAAYGSEHWTTSLALILALAPPRSLRSLCSKLSDVMISDNSDGSIFVEAGIPAIIGMDVEKLLSCTTHLALDCRVTMATSLRYSIGGGSVRAVTAGPQFLDVVSAYVRLLLRDRYAMIAWDIIGPLDDRQLPYKFRRLRQTVAAWSGGYATNRGAARAAVSAQGDVHHESRALYGRLGSSSTTVGPRAAASLPQNVPRGFPLPPTPQHFRSPASTNTRGLPLPPTPQHFRSSFSPLVVNPMCPVYSQGFPREPAMYDVNRGLGAIPPLTTFGHATTTAPIFDFGGLPAMPNAEAYPGQLIGTQSGFPPTDFGQSFLPPVASCSLPPPPTTIGNFNSSMQGSLFSSSAGGTLFAKKAETVHTVTEGFNVLNFGWNEPSPNWNGIGEPFGQFAFPAGEGSSHRGGMVDGRHEPTAVAAPSLLLSDDDRVFIATLRDYVEDMRRGPLNQMFSAKVTTFEEKIASELIPRLSHPKKFAHGTMIQLYGLGVLIRRRQLHKALEVCGVLATGIDFAEVSSFLPSLKAVLLLGYQLFGI